MSNLKTLIDKHRHINVEHDWWDNCYEQFIHKLDTLGLDVSPDDMSFSGFWSQGDGASFTGYIHRDNMKKFMEEHALHLIYPAAYYFAQQNELSAKLVRSASHYCHENTVRIDINTDYMAADLSEYEDSDDPRDAVYCVMWDKFWNEEFSNFEEQVQSACRGWMKLLYNELECDYEALTSDEAVLDTLQANNMLTNEGEENGIRCD